MRRNDWIMVACGGLILCIGMGSRQSYGIFLKPISADLQVGRELWSFANSLSMLLMGVFAPFVGGLADRYGAARTIAAGGVVYIAGTVLLAFADNGVILTLGTAIGGIGLSAAGMGPILGVIGRNTHPQHRSLMLGIASAGASFGQFAIVPTVSALQDRLQDWHSTMLLIALGSAVIVALAIGLREPPRKAPVAGQSPFGARQAFAEAFAHRGFLLLTLGFFVCGFHVAFVGLHLPAYISDQGIGLKVLGLDITPAQLGGWAIGLVGLFNVVGSIMWGWLGGKHQRKDMLALLYLLRALVFLLFLIVPLSSFSVLAFAGALGFLWLGTVPLTSGLVGFMFGPTHVSMLFGVVFLSHQVGSFVGGWGGGRLYDLFGNYDAMWWISIGLGFAAALCNWPIRERPVARLAPRPA